MSRYKINRIGFVNFWLYDQEDFYFCDGKLLLRGTNGSGKTVTMQSFFPLIFDGNKSPERLDPFGSRDRKIEDYLLPEDFSGNENTGYLYMEFYKKDENKYLTIGIGLRAIRNRPCEFWGFALTDNRRIGTDCLLFKERNLRIPLTKKELQTRIGTGGEFVESTKEYKKMVNNLLFGFENIDLYTEFINLLIQVRSPKLSNSTRPSQLTKILSTVLEPLSEDDLREMSDSIENMNKYKEKLADIQNQQNACTSLKVTFDAYNQSILYQKGENYLHHKQEQERVQKTIAENEQSLLMYQEETAQANKMLETLTLEEAELKHRKAQLEETDLKAITAQFEELAHQIKELEVEKNQKDKEKQQKEDLLVSHQNTLKEKENALSKVEKSFEDLLSDLTSYEEDIQFDDAKFYLDDLKKERMQFNDMNSFVTTVQRQVSLLTTLQEIANRVDQKEQEITSLKEQYASQNDQIELYNRKRNEISASLVECANDLKDYFARTINENQVLKIEQSTLNALYERIDSLEKDIELKLREILKNQVYAYKGRFSLEISNYEIQKNTYQAKIDTLHDELEHIQNCLYTSFEDGDAKQYFKEHNITYQYFFETVQFKENVKESVRKEIESFLYETGMMSAFIVNDSISNGDIQMKCLSPGIPVEHNLSDYLEPVQSDNYNQVLQILKSISLEEGAAIHLKGGKYQFALLKGTVNKDHELRFIGEEVRKNYIEKQREKIEIAIDQFTKEISSIEEKKQMLISNMDIVEEEYQQFVFPKEFLEYFKQLDEVNFTLERMNALLEESITMIGKMTSELRGLEEELDAKKKGYYGSTKYEVLTEILDSTKNYLELLRQLASTFQEYTDKEDLVQNVLQMVQTTESDLENLRIDFSKLEFKLKDCQNKKQTLVDLLSSDKYKDVGNEYRKISDRLEEIEKLIPKNNEIVTANKVRIDYVQKELEQYQEKLKELELLVNVTYQIWKEEYDLHYVSLSPMEESEIASFVKTLKSAPPYREAYEKFNDSVSKYVQLLVEFAPKNVILHTPQENAYLNFTNEEIRKEQVTKLLEEATRRDLVFNYKGKNVNLLELIAILTSETEIYENYISEENRRIFEDHLLNNMGGSIRQKIYQSEEWIENVRNYMESMQTSSGLSFSLKWTGLQALTEEEMDTKEIVDIFRKDAANLKPEHLTKIANHFKSKIKMKEDMLEESERNYFEIMKDVLDYRKWFEFKLYFKRGNSDKKELTDREFNKMSGGEKAIAMYVPLFASIYAKLGSAYESAPHAIALDEAFAGVDDANILDAFRILEKLDIDYVLTSQQLFGDYETVKHLAISELHHPIGSKVVSIIKYKWDGIRRSRIEDVSEYQV